MPIGENIRKFRIQKGLTQKQVADKCGMADSAIRKYESGAQLPKTDTLKRIAVALGVNIADLDESLVIYLGTNYIMRNSDGELIRVSMDTPVGKLLSKFDQLNDKGREIAIDRVSELTEISKYQRRSSMVPPHQLQTSGTGTAEEE